MVLCSGSPGKRIRVLDKERELFGFRQHQCALRPALFVGFLNPVSLGFPMRALIPISDGHSNEYINLELLGQSPHGITARQTFSGSLVWASSVLGPGEEVRVPALQEFIAWRRGKGAK